MIYSRYSFSFHSVRSSSEMTLHANSIFERDMVVEKVDADGKVDVCVLRGRFPPPFHWILEQILPLKRVPGSFVNTTTLPVPCTVSSFLSLGPKFILPSFTLVGPGEKDDGWFTLLSKLGGVDYFVENSVLDFQELQRLYEAHVGDRYSLSRIDRSILMLAATTCNYLRRVRHLAMVVEGDKGKLVGLVYRASYCDMVDAYLTAGLESGK